MHFNMIVIHVNLFWNLFNFPYIDTNSFSYFTHFIVMKKKIIELIIKSSQYLVFIPKVMWRNDEIIYVMFSSKPFSFTFAIFPNIINNYVTSIPTITAFVSHYHLFHFYGIVTSWNEALDLLACTATQISNQYVMHV